MQPIKSIEFLITAIALYAIPSPVGSQNLPRTTSEPLDNNRESEVTEPISQPEIIQPSKPQPKKNT